MTTPATSGPPSPESFAWYDPESCSWKTSQLSLLPTTGGSSGTSSVTWPKQGTTQSGRAYERPTLVLLTAASGCSLLPTPTATNMNDGETLDNWLARKERLTAERMNGNGMGTPLAVAVRLLPTPSTEDRGHDAPNRTGGGFADCRRRLARWGQYAAAVARWEPIVGELAPDPLDERGRLNVALSRWMMGAPPGWHGDLSRTAALRGYGNGVVVQVGQVIGEWLNEGADK